MPDAVHPGSVIAVPLPRRAEDAGWRNFEVAVHGAALEVVDGLGVGLRVGLGDGSPDGLGVGVCDGDGVTHPQVGAGVGIGGVPLGAGLGGLVFVFTGAPGPSGTAMIRRIRNPGSGDTIGRGVVAAGPATCGRPTGAPPEGDSTPMLFAVAR